MVSATGDWTRNTPREEYPAVRAIYELYDRVVNLDMVQIDAPHNYNKQSREARLQILRQTGARRNRRNQTQREKHSPRKLGDMLALHNRKLPDNALDLEGVRAQWIRLGQANLEVARRWNSRSAPSGPRT